MIALYRGFSPSCVYLGVSQEKFSPYQTPIDKKHQICYYRFTVFNKFQQISTNFNKGSFLTTYERRQSLLELLRSQPGIRVPEVAEALDVSEGTVRNDLNALE